MELLDRYLQAVKKHLPWERQDDIIAELKANLEAQLEDKEAELGRPLTTAEIEAWLKKMGAPFKVAARYFPQQYLIGPAVFRLYWLVLRMAVLWAVIINLIVSGVLLLARSSSPSAVVEAIVRIPGVVMWVAAWVTLIFAAIEFGVTHYPSKFQALTGDSFDWPSGAIAPAVRRSVSGKQSRSYAQALAEVVFGFLFLIWLLLIPQHPYLLMGPGVYFLQASPFQAAPVLFPVYWSIVALNVIQLVWRCIDLIRGSWRGPRRAQHFAVKIFGLIPLALLLMVENQAYFTLRHPALDQTQYGAALTSINLAIHMGLAVVCVIVVVQMAWDIGQIGIGAYRKRAAAKG